jgi:hypothetical protein
VHAGGDEIVAKPPQHFGANRTFGVNRRDKIGKDAVKIRHGEK